MDDLSGTHKNWWECDTGIAYLVASEASNGVDRRQPSEDLRPERSREPRLHPRLRIARIAAECHRVIGHQKGIGIHGPISAGPKANRVYIAYGSGGEGVLQIVDRQKLLTAFKNPVNPTDEEMLAPQARRGRHVARPRGALDDAVFDIPIPTNDGHPNLKTRDLVIVASEQGREARCGESPRPNDPLSPHWHSSWT